MYEYTATCIRVIDGDTLVLDLDLGCHVHIIERVRLMGVDTPETYGVKKGSEEYLAGKQATAYTQEFVQGQTLTVKTFRDKKGKYGRYIAEIYRSDGRCLNTELIEKHYSDEVAY